MHLLNQKPCNKLTLNIFLIALAFSSNALAVTFNVNNNGDANDSTPGDGVCATANVNAVCTLRAAISETNALTGTDTINLPADTYTIQSSAGSNNTSGSFFISDSLNLIGADASTTIISANFLTGVMFIQASGHVALSNISITNGNAGTTTTGGGIYLAGESLIVTLSNSIISGNSAGTGAGIGWGSPVNSVTIQNSLIDNNHAIGEPGQFPSFGGGINASTGTLVVRNSTISNNTSNFGGGIATIGTVILEDSLISGNTAIAVINVNYRYSGGGIQVGSGDSATLTSINSTISGNHSYGSGAGILMVNGTASLYNTTVTGNYAGDDTNESSYGGGIAGSDSLPRPEINITNSLIADNYSNSGMGSDCWTSLLTFTSYGYNIIGNATGCTITQSTGDMFGTVDNPIDPMLDSLADNGGDSFTHALKPDSPAIDAGNPTTCTDNAGEILSNDQRGNPRHYGVDERCDIGAYEMNFTLSANAGIDQNVNINNVVTLNANTTQSSRDIASYAWAEVGTASVTLTNPSSATPEFTAPSTATTLTFELTITDINGAMSTDTVVINVTANTAPVSGNGNSNNNGGTFDLWTGLLMLFSVMYFRRHYPRKSSL